MANKPTSKGGKAPKTATTTAAAAQAPAPVAVAAPQAPPPALPWVGTQNGVVPPKRAGLCSAVWQLTSGGAPLTTPPPQLPSVAQVKVAGAAQGLNPANVQIEYYRCRAWYGVRGRQAQAPATTA